MFGEVSLLKLQQAGSGRSSKLEEMIGQGWVRNQNPTRVSRRGEGQGQGSALSLELRRTPPVFLPEGLGSSLILSPQHTDTRDKGGTIACRVNTCLFRDEIAAIDLV